jgi:hypothetical protein
MPPTQIQQVQTVVGSQSTVSLSFASLPAIGNLIIVSCAAWSNTAEASLGVTGIQDNQGHGFYSYIDEYDATGSNVHMAKYFMVVTASSGTFTVTLDPVVAAAVMALQLEEWHGCLADVVNVLRTQAKAEINSGTVVATGSYSVTAGDLTHASVTSTISDPTYTANGGLTMTQEETDNNTFQEISSAQRVESSTGTTTAQFTGSLVASGSVYGIIAAVFKPEVSGPPGPAFESIDPPLAMQQRMM